MIYQLRMSADEGWLSGYIWTTNAEVETNYFANHNNEDDGITTQWKQQMNHHHALHPPRHHDELEDIPNQDFDTLPISALLLLDV